MKLSKRAAARILLVKALEETPGVSIPPRALFQATARAGEPAPTPDWFDRRARSLLEEELRDVEPVLGVISPPVGMGWAVVGTTLLLGLATNYLGPEGRIRVLYNPLVLLVLWNLATYVALAVSPLLGRRVVARPPRRDEGTRRGDQDGRTVGRTPRIPWIVRVAWRTRTGAARWWSGPIRKVRGGRDAFLVFAHDWLELAHPGLLPTVRRYLNLGAIGIATGALLGMYVRGLVLEYNVVWRSTFLRDPDTVATILRTVFAVPARLVGAEPPSVETARWLLTDGGMPAAYWIHVFAGTMLLAVVLPRAALAVWQTLRARVVEGRLELDLDGPYFRAVVVRAREIRLRELRKEIETIVRDESEALADEVVLFATETLYDGRLTPRIVAFRETGGRIADLKAALVAECEHFRPELERHVGGQVERFETALSRRVRELLGSESGSARGTAALESAIHGAARDSAVGAGASVGAGIADPVAVAVSAAIAGMAGAVSGGFGKTLGTAILVGLGTSGPVGFAIGALAGLVLAGAGYLAGREKIAARVDQVELPPAAVKAMIWRGRLDAIVRDGRARFGDHVRERIAESLDEVRRDLEAHLWNGLQPVLGERLRGTP